MDKSIGLKDALKSFYPLLILIAAIELLIWVHWNSLLETASYWDNPKYSYSYLVPLFAGMLLYLRRDETVPVIKSLATLGVILLGAGLLLCVLPFVLPDSIQTMGFLSSSLFESIGVGLSCAGALLIIQQRIPFSQISAAERWIGLGIVGAAEFLRLWATHTSHYTPERFSFILALAGVFIMIGGLQCMRWAGRSIAFLIFMLPLPAVLDSTLAAHLQTWATVSSTYVLQTVGVGAVRTGNVISVGKEGIPMEVETACSGLHMLTVFVALCVAVVLVVDFPIWQRIVIVISSMPIALAVNIMRITGTGILFTILPASQENLREFFHGGAGLAMPPLALVMLFLEYKILSNLFVEDDEGLARPISPPIGAPAGGPSLAIAGIGGSPIAAKPLPPKPQARVAPKPVAPKPAAPRPLPVNTSAGAVPGSPIAAKPLPTRTQTANTSSSAPKPVPQKPLPAKPLPPKPAPAAASGPIPARPLPAKPLPPKPVPSAGPTTNDK